VLNIDEIVKGCKQYNKAYQHLLYERYASEIRYLCFRYLNNTIYLDDILHDGFIKVFMNISQYSGKGSFEGWMKKIFINTALKHNLKHNLNKAFIDIDKIYEVDDDENFQVIDVKLNVNYENINNDNSEYNIETNQLADLSEQEILEIIKKIPEKLRVVFNLFCIEDFSHDEISEILKIDSVTSRTRLLRARNCIKKELNELCLSKNRI
jgi:RNA polymerase sigma-70 factor, ECF subfamily